MPTRVSKGAIAYWAETNQAMKGQIIAKISIIDVRDKQLPEIIVKEVFYRSGQYLIDNWRSGAITTLSVEHDLTDEYGAIKFSFEHLGNI